MTRPFLIRLAPLMFAVLVVSCGGTSGTSPSAATGPSPVPSPSPAPAPSPAPIPPPATSGCIASITGLPSSVPAQSGRYTFAITIGSNCAWRAQADVSWADVAPGSGQGSATPVLNVGENTNFDARTITVTVNGQSFRVTQNAVSCSYTLNPTSLDESPDGGSASVSLTATAGCTWTATASEGWIRVLTPSGTGSGTINLDLAPNPSDVRHAFLTIAGQRVNVTQRRR